MPSNITRQLADAAQDLLLLLVRSKLRPQTQEAYDILQDLVNQVRDSDPEVESMT